MTSLKVLSLLITPISLPFLFVGLYSLNSFSLKINYLSLVLNPTDFSNIAPSISYKMHIVHACMHEVRLPQTCALHQILFTIKTSMHMKSGYQICTMSYTYH